MLASAVTIALPAFALGIRQSALITRMMRSAMLDVLDEPYIVTARAQGLEEGLVIRRYAMRTAAIPVVTVAGLSASYLLSGAVAIELIFSLPGLGRLLVDAVGAAGLSGRRRRGAGDRADARGPQSDHRSDLRAGSIHGCGCDGRR